MDKAMLLISQILFLLFAAIKTLFWLSFLVDILIYVDQPSCFADLFLFRGFVFVPGQQSVKLL